MRRPLVIVGSLNCVFAVASPALIASAVARAQTTDYLTVLTLPPTRVGTCMPLSADSAARNGRSMPAHHIVIVSQPPGARREISVFTSDRGERIGYSELAMRFEPPAQSTGAQVVASLDSRGVVRGVLTLSLTRMTPPPTGARIDSASMRAMGETARTSTTKTALAAEQQAQVRRIARWLVERCP